MGVFRNGDLIMGSLSAEHRTTLRSDTRAAAAILLEDLQYFRTEIARNETSKAEMRRLSATVRRLLVNRNWSDRDAQNWEARNSRSRLQRRLRTPSSREAPQVLWRWGQSVRSKYRASSDGERWPGAAR